MYLDTIIFYSSSTSKAMQVDRYVIATGTHGALVPCISSIEDMTHAGMTASLMQKPNTLSATLVQATYLPKVTHLSTTPLHMLRKDVKRTAAPGTIITSRKRYDAIVDVDSHKVLLLRLRAVDMVGVSIVCVIPAVLRGLTS